MGAHSMAFTRLIALQLFGIILCLFVGIAEQRGESGYNSNNDYYASKAQSGEYEVSYGHSARLIDDYVCDLDASILMVTNSEKSYQKVNNYGKSKGAGKNYGEEKPMGPPKGGAAGSYGPGPQETAGNYGPPQPAHYHQPEYPAAKRAKRDAPAYGYGGGQEEGGEYHHSPEEQEEEDNNNYGGPYAKSEGGEEYGGKKKTSGSYSGGGASYTVAKAHRLRCSAIAVNSDEDCKKCCYMAARKERSIPKDSIVGFIVDYDEVRQPSTGYQPSGPYRAKRETAATAGEEQVYPPAVMPEGKYEKLAGDSAAGEYASQGGSAAPTGYGANNYQQQPPHQNYYTYPTKPKNPRCVCCAPKTHSGSISGYQQQQQSGYGYSSGYGNKRNNDNNGYYGGPKPRAFPKKPHNYGGSGEQYHGQNYGEEENGGEYHQQQQPHGHGYGREGDYAAGGPSAPPSPSNQQYNNNKHQHKYHARRQHQQDYNQAEAKGEEYGQNNNEGGEHEQEVSASEYAVEHKQQQYGGQKQPKQQYGNGKQYGKMKAYASAEREY